MGNAIARGILTPHCLPHLMQGLPPNRCMQVEVTNYREVREFYGDEQDEDYALSLLGKSSLH